MADDEPPIPDPLADEDDGREPIRNPSEDDYNQRQRLKEIWEERQSVREWRREIDHSIGQRMSQSEGEEHFHKELRSFIGIVHTLLLDEYAEEGGRELWTEMELGEQVIEPPNDISDHADPKTNAFQGVRSLIETPPTRTVTFAATKERHQKSDMELTSSKEVTVPWHILENAWLELIAFLSSIGLEAERKDSEPKDGFLDL